MLAGVLQRRWRISEEIKPSRINPLEDLSDEEETNE